MLMLECEEKKDGRKKEMKQETVNYIKKTDGKKKRKREIKLDDINYIKIAYVKEKKKERK